MADTVLTPEVASGLVDVAIQSFQANDARTLQSEAGTLGPSDIGFCRQQVTLKLKGVAPTDSTPKWAAACGTAVGEWVEKALKIAYPDWIIGSIDHQRVTATLADGTQVSGTPDIIVPSMNAVLDLKTKDGLNAARKYGDSINYKYQRYLYALGAVQAGILDGDKPLYVGNVYLDRSGGEATPYATIELFDPAYQREIEEWVSDVKYAVDNDEEASRDIAPEVCSLICEFYTACRGGFLPDSDAPEVITAPELVNAASMYDEGRRLAKEGDSLKKEASRLLMGHNGLVGEYQLRWTEVGASDVPGYTRQSYQKINLAKRRR
jgi:hypothetical protein